MPPPPTFKEKANTVIKFFQNPCDAPWVVYAELAYPALGEAVLELLSFGFDDVVRGALRPKGLRSGRHGRKGGVGSALSKAIPELGEMIGTAVPGAAAARGRHVSDGVKHLWILDGVVQRGLFYWMIADVSFNFFYNWASAIQKTQYCVKAEAGAAFSESPPDSGFAGIPAWVAIFTSIQVYQRGSANALQGTCSNGGKPYNCGFSLSGTNPTIFEVSVYTRVRKNNFTTQLAPQKDVDWGEKAEWVMETANGGKSTTFFEILGVGIGYLVGQATCWCMGP